MSTQVHSIDLDKVEGEAPDTSKWGVSKARLKDKKRKRAKSEHGAAIEKFTRGDKNSLKGIKSHKLRQTLKNAEDVASKSIEESASAQILLPTQTGHLEAEGEMERTWRISQQSLGSYIDERSQARQFELKLDEFGPYSFDFTRNGRHMLLGGRKGHIALMDWRTMKLTYELHVRETIRDVSWLHDETMLAVAQKKYLYIYDNTGTELHCMKNHFDINVLEFLPYHFLLASVGKSGYLKYLDTSTGENIAEHRTKLGEVKVMKQNPANAILCLGHNNGSVTMWSPNMTTPLVKMLCHRAPVLDVAVDRGGYYLATSGLDGQLKIWDVRTYKEIHSYFTPQCASSLDISDSGLLAAGGGNTVRIWKGMLSSEKQKSPYMVEKIASSVQRVRFVPYEDALGVTHQDGLQSMVIPGAGEANFDTFEANPFQTTKQRRERTVNQLLEKLQSDMITLDPNMFGLMNKASKEVLTSERRAIKEEKAKEQLAEAGKMRGRSRSSKRWRRKRKNIIDAEFASRNDKIQKKHALQQNDKKDAIRKSEGKAKDTLDRFKKIGAD